ncbi:uncharacterized protein LOC130665448 [Microplitis mediator]|uniref:uncharacterized protein LOC130665448 n=1 Tax=Microplitis mediator TaxID=375433 RepID=UPI00255493E2|nr:uncharacterized protein LOC130665448 [Microplitis mediator]
MLLNRILLILLLAIYSTPRIGAIPTESSRSRETNQLDLTSVALQIDSKLNYVLCGEHAVLNRTMRAPEVRCYDDMPPFKYKNFLPECACIDGYMRNSANICIKAADCGPYISGFNFAASEDEDPAYVDFFLVINNFSHIFSACRNYYLWYSKALLS